MDILQNIERIIADTDLTLTQIEKDCGFSKSSMRKWSENFPSVDKALAVAKYLNVSVDYLLTGTTLELPTEDQRLLAAYRAADEGTRRSVDKLLDINVKK